MAQEEINFLEKKVEIDITEEAKEWLAKEGYDEKMGARPLDRLIHDKIKKPLSEEILFGKLENGGKVTIDIKDDELVFEYPES